MTNIELIAARKALNMDIRDAAEKMFKVEPRTWRYYESGRSPIPENLEQRVLVVLQRYKEVLENRKLEASEYLKKGKGRIALPLYPTFPDYLKDFGIAGSEPTPDQYVEWRVQSAVKMQLYAAGLVRLYWAET